MAELALSKVVWLRAHPLLPEGKGVHPSELQLSFPGGSAGKESACNAEDLGSIPGLWKFLHLPTLGWWSFFFFFPKLCHHFGWFNPSEGWPMNHPRFKIPWTLLFQNSHPPLHLSWNLSLPFSVPEHNERNTVWKIMNRIERCCKFIFSKHK